MGNGIKRSSQHNNNNNDGSLTDADSGLMEDGKSMYLQDEIMVPIVRESAVTKTMAVPENDGQTMMDKSFMGTGKKWKPKGRK